MVKEGYPFVLPPFLLACVLAYLGYSGPSRLAAVGAALFIFVTAFMAYFFRDPERSVPQGSDIVVSPADGRVTRVEQNDEGRFVSIFLSPLDVHVNRAPVGGQIIRVDYVKGKKTPATSDESSLVNERNSITIKGERLTVRCTQIAGIVARRIVCWKTEGDTLALGQRYGLIKFSSRTDIQMPPNVEVLVEVGDRVVGGETVIARLSA